jgi:acetolactate synthase-1/2/3 large subunit
LQPQLQELETLRRENLPIKIFVVNNDGYSSIRVSQSRYFNRLVGADARSGLTIPSFNKIAAAYGLRYAKIDNQDNLTKTLASVLAGGDPVICEVVVPSEEDRVPRLANMQKPDGTMVSKPLEDLFPFLPRDEFLENMIIPPIDE